MSNENTSTANLHSKQWVHEAETKFKEILTFLVWLEMTLSMHLSAGGWLNCKSKLIRLSCRYWF